MLTFWKLEVRKVLPILRRHAVDILDLFEGAAEHIFVNRSFLWTAFVFVFVLVFSLNIIVDI